MVVPSRMGWAAPASVPGAMAAMSADSSRKKPAEPARLPEGSMKMMTGTGEASMSATISRVESSRPPGVPMEMRTAEAWRAAASSRPRLRYSAVMGWMVSWMVSLTTRGDCAGRGRAKASEDEGEDGTKHGATPAVCGRVVRIRQNADGGYAGQPQRRLCARLRYRGTWSERSQRSQHGTTRPSRLG